MEAKIYQVTKRAQSFRRDRSTALPPSQQLNPQALVRQWSTQSDYVNFWLCIQHTLQDNCLQFNLIFTTKTQWSWKLNHVRMIFKCGNWTLTISCFLKLKTYLISFPKTDGIISSPSVSSCVSSNYQLLKLTMVPSLKDCLRITLKATWGPKPNQQILGTDFLSDELHA